MRKLIVCNIVSLDGFFTGPGGNVMVMPFGSGFSEYNVKRLREADTLVLGRTTFEGFRQYWPKVQDDPAQSELEREISRLNTAAPKLVVTDSLVDADLTGWGPARAVRRADAAAAVAALKREAGRDILVFGSHTVWNHLLAAGLVDELHLMIGAGLVGDGIRAFEGKAPVQLRLLDAAPIDTSLVLVRYGVEAAK